MTAISVISEELQVFSPLKCEIYRGDSFQIVVNRPEMAMLIAILLRAGLKSRIHFAEYQRFRCAPGVAERGARRIGKNDELNDEKVVLLRHGESTWNRENRFTGWTDVDLSEKGVAEAEKAGRLLRGGFSVRTCLYLLPETGREDARRRTRQAGSGLGAGFEELAAQREALRLFAGTQQKGNGREIRRRAGAHLAPQL